MADDIFTTRMSFTADEALALHSSGRPGKLETRISKPLTTARDLSLAYSPGVAVPCLRIAANPELAWDYTTRGNMVAVVSNGTAVLGLGNIGALAGKPVMEGKVALFKRFADVDGIDLEVDTENVDEFVNCVRFLGPSFGGINLEDIKAPECFVIEERLRASMDIPVFHDDQHGTAIVAAAGFLNACHLTGRDLATTTLVVNGAGAAGIACIDLLLAMGMRKSNIFMCDTKGILTRERSDLNQWKSAHARDTHLRTLGEALEGADAFFGLSAKGALTQDMVRRMAARPIIFAMANPDPEITPEEAREASPDAIIATGRSDYPNQVNNVLGFPYIFRGALDVRARTINEAMKTAAVEALAKLAREDVPDEVHRASQRDVRFGPEYIIPNCFDPRLISRIPPAVAKAAMDSGVAARPIGDMRLYARELGARLDTARNALDLMIEGARDKPQRIVFAEGEDEKMVRAAYAFFNEGYGTPLLIGREDRVMAAFVRLGLEPPAGIEIHNARLSSLAGGDNARYADFLYRRLQRSGYLERDAQRMVNTDRNVFAACMVGAGDADGMVTGLTRAPSHALAAIRLALDAAPGSIVFGETIMFGSRGTLIVADTLVTAHPTAQELAMIAIGAAASARRLGETPRVALCSHSTFGQPMNPSVPIIRDATRILESLGVDFEFDGDISPEVALEPNLLAIYPFCRLTGSANVLVMPDLASAHIATRLASRLGDTTTVGPILLGLARPAQIVPMDATVGQIVNLAGLAASHAARR